MKISLKSITIQLWHGWFTNLRDKDDPEDIENFWVFQFHILPFVMLQRDVFVHNSVTFGWLFFSFKICWG